MSVVKTGRWENSRKKAMKRGTIPRLLLCLMDGKEHEFSEFYDWVKEAIEPTMAMREYKRDKNKVGEEVSYDKMIEEGRRKSLLCSFWKFEKQNYIKVTWPNRELSRGTSSGGFYNMRKCRMQITEVGVKHILEGTGVYSKITSELYLAMKARRLGVSVSYLGLPAMEVMSEVE